MSVFTRLLATDIPKTFDNVVQGSSGYRDSLLGYYIEGNSVQSGTASVDNPLTFKGVGNIISIFSKETNIQMRVTPEASYPTITTNLTIDLPLYKLGDLVDSLSWGTGKNLFNKDTVTMGHVLDENTGEPVADSNPNSWVSHWIKIESNTVYYFKTAVREYVRMLEYTSDKTYNNVNYIARNSTFVTSANCKYIRCYVRGNEGGAELLAGETMLWKGSTAPKHYEPYSRTPHIRREVGVKIFDGTETFTSTHSSFGYTFICGNILKAASTTTAGNCVCTHFPSTGSIYATKFSLTNGVTVNFNVSTSMPWTSTSAFKAWLTERYNAGTPVTIYYPLETPTEDNVYIMETPIFKGTNTYSCNTEVTPSDLNVQAWCWRF